MWIKKLFAQIGRAFKLMVKPFDEIDFIMLVGLVLLWWGVHQVSHWIASALVGSVLIVFSFIAGRKS